MKKENKEYSKLLLDPRWQKRRLEIMSRDKWVCQKCGNGLNDGTTLNVHHLVYKKGYMPWEYGDNDLITLCEKCHNDTHKKTINTNQEVFYRYLLTFNELTPNEKIILSYLTRRSFYSQNQPIDKTKIAKKLGLTRQNVTTSIKKLQVLGFCDDNGTIYNKTMENIVEHGYFELVGQEKLKGELLIFYSYLLQKSKRYRYCIDTYKCKLAEELGKTTTAITKLLNRLYKLDLAKRLDNGKLKIYHFKTNNNETN